MVCITPKKTACDTVNIDQLISEYNEIAPTPVNIKSKEKYTIRVVNISPIRSNRRVTITRIANILGVKGGDEILYTLDNNGYINMRKSDSPGRSGSLRTSERYISANIVHYEYDRNNSINKSPVVIIPSDILNLLGIKIGDDLVFILDENNIILQSTIFPGSCPINGKIIVFTKLLFNQRTTITEDIKDLKFIETGDIVVFGLKDNNIIINPIEDIDDNYLALGMSKISSNETVFLRKKLIDIIHPNEDSLILWILDADGDIILKNTSLPKDCKKKIINE